jgi:hypothetical protein
MVDLENRTSKHAEKVSVLGSSESLESEKLNWLTSLSSNLHLRFDVLYVRAASRFHHVFYILYDEHQFQGSDR